MWLSYLVTSKITEVTKVALNEVKRIVRSLDFHAVLPCGGYRLNLKRPSKKSYHCKIKKNP